MPSLTSLLGTRGLVALADYLVQLYYFSILSLSFMEKMIHPHTLNGPFCPGESQFMPLVPG